MVTRRIVGWLDDRLEMASFAKKQLRKAFPDHWSFLIGEVALYSFVILVLTGTFLTFFFVPSTREVVYQGPFEPLQGETVSAAYDSVLRISFEVRAGAVMRYIHHWGALLFLAAISFHVLRIFFTGAFRRPRELNWVIGVGLLLLAMAAGFTGYSLPDDLLSGTGLRIIYSIILGIPFVGPWAAFLIFGGEFPTADMIGRLFVLHIMVVPALLALGIGGHLAIVWRQKHTQFPGPGRSEHVVVGSPFWPHYTLKSTGLALLVFAVLALLAGLFQINQVWLYGPYDATTVSSPAQPDWYIGWIEGALRLGPPWEFRILGVYIPSALLAGVVLPGAFFTIMLLWPFIERRISGDDGPHELLDRPRDRPWRTGVGVGIVVFAGVLTIAGSNDVLAVTLGVPVETLTAVLRVSLLLAPPIAGYGAFLIARNLRDRSEPPEGRVTLRRTSAGGYEEEEPPSPGER